MSDEFISERSDDYIVELERNFDVQSLVSNTGWRELLIDSVYKNRLDPWNIDISRVVSDYVAAIDSMKLMDLSVPANIIMAMSFLLRLKSELVQIFQNAPEQEEVEAAYGERSVPDIPDLMFRVRRAPNRKITLEELMSALDDVIRVEHKREEYLKRTETQQQFVVEIDDMDDKVDRIYDMIMASSNGNSTIIFDELSKNVDRNSILSDLFVPLLFLEQNGRISLRQDVFFGDIYISVK